MLNACYKVFHKEGIDSNRDYCYNQITSVLSKSYPELDTPTVYLKNFDEVDEFYKEHPEFRFNKMPAFEEGGTGFPPTSGTVGVFASNYLAYKAFLNSPYDYLIIFEDDVVVSPTFVPVVERYIQELPSGWDFFSVFVPPDCFKWYNSDYDIPGNTFVCRTYQDWSCACYIVNKTSAQKVIDDAEAKGIDDPIDWHIFNSRQLDMYKMRYTEEAYNRDAIYFNTYSPKPSAYHPVKFHTDTANESTITSTEFYWG